MGFRIILMYMILTMESVMGRLLVGKRRYIRSILIDIGKIKDISSLEEENVK